MASRPRCRCSSASSSSRTSSPATTTFTGWRSSWPPTRRDHAQWLADRRAHRHRRVRRWLSAGRDVHSRTDPLSPERMRANRWPVIGISVGVLVTLLFIPDGLGFWRYVLLLLGGAMGGVGGRIAYKLTRR